MNPEVSCWNNTVSLCGTNNNSLGLTMKDPWLKSQLNQSTLAVTSTDSINANTKVCDNDQLLNGLVSQMSRITVNSSIENIPSLTSPWSSTSHSLMNNHAIWNSSSSGASSHGPNGINSTLVTDSWNLKSGWSSSLNTTTTTDVSLKDMWPPMSTAGGSPKSQQNDKQDSQSVRSSNSRAVTPTPKSSGPVSDTASVLSEKSKLSNEEYINSVVNTPHNWGKIPVDQSTPWNCDDIKGKTGDFSKSFQNQVDPNVWISEPPTGTRIWEAYYESIGKKTASWKGLQPEVCNTPTPTSVWSAKNEISGLQSPIQSSVFGNDSWIDTNSDWPFRNKSEMSYPADDLMNGTGRLNSNWNTAMLKKPDPFDKNHPNSSKMISHQNGKTGNNNRVMQMRIHAIKHLTDLGFKKEDAQNALITNNMDIERAIADLSGTRSRPIFPPNSMGSVNRIPSSNNQEFPYWDSRNEGNLTENPVSNQQEFMKQQIASQLRNAVQNPNNFYPIFQLKQTETNLKQTIHSLIEQMQIDGSPQLRQQHDATMKQLQTISKQINQLTTNNNKSNLNQQNKQFNQGSSFYTNDRHDPSMLKRSPNGVDSSPQSYSRFLSQVDHQKSAFNSYDCSSAAKPIYGRSLSSQIGPSQWHSFDVHTLNSHGDPYLNKASQPTGIDAINNPNMSPFSAFPTDVNPGPVNVTEFVPGKPWQGTSVLSNDDPAITPGSVRGLLTVNNDRLEKLIKSDLNCSKPWNDNGDASMFSQNGFANSRNWSMNYNSNGAPMEMNVALSVYLIVQNLDGNSAEFVKMTCQSTGSMTSFHPNPKSAWVLVSFVSRNEAARARQNLQSYGFQVDHIMEHEVLQYTREVSARIF